LSASVPQLWSCSKRCLRQKRRSHEGQWDMAMEGCRQPLKLQSDLGGAALTWGRHGAQGGGGGLCRGKGWSVAIVVRRGGWGRLRGRVCSRSHGGGGGRDSTDARIVGSGREGTLRDQSWGNVRSDPAGHTQCMNSVALDCGMSATNAWATMEAPFWTHVASL
jgi:hypothetical protein